MRIRTVATAVLLVLTWAGYRAIRSHYLPYGEGFRFPVANLAYALAPVASVPVWHRGDFVESFQAKMDGLGSIQIQFAPYPDKVPPHNIDWKLEELSPQNPGQARLGAIRRGSFPSTETQLYGFARMRFFPIAESAMKSYRLTLSAPGVSFAQSTAVYLFPTMDPAAVGAQPETDHERPHFSTILDNTAMHDPNVVMLPGGVTYTQLFQPDLKRMSSLQVQFVSPAGPGYDYTLWWSVTRESNGSRVADGQMSSLDFADWQLADLRFPQVEECAGQTYRLTLTGQNTRGPYIGLPLYRVTNRLASGATTNSKQGMQAFPGQSALLISVDSPSIPALRLVNPSNTYSLNAGRSLSSNTTIWYFPRAKI